VLDQLRAAALAGGGPARLARQHAAGKLSARERLRVLLDDGSFHETGQVVGRVGGHPGDGVVTGRGTVAGRNVYVFSQDFTVAGGSLGELHAAKIARVMDLALQARSPVVGLSDSGGARIQEGVAALAGYTNVFRRNVHMSGVVPQISVIMGPCAGGAVYSPALTDFVVMVQTTAHMFLTGPEVVESVTQEKISREDLGGARMHSTRSGVCHLVGENDVDALRRVRELLSYIPDAWDAALDSPGRLMPSSDPTDREDPALDCVVPLDANQPYDMHHVLRRIVDNGKLLELHGGWATNVITGFARMGGEAVGIIANQPMKLAGVLDVNASCKAARHVRFCDAFNIPILTFVDVPGFLPGSSQEHGGIIRHGAKLLFAYAEASVPKLTVITRKAYGGAYCVMSSKQLGADYNYAWPTAEVAVMGAAGATRILHKGDEEKAARAAEEYALEHCSPVAAARRGDVDEVIAARHTRTMLCQGLYALRRKGRTQHAHGRFKRKHGCIPL
jgi:propionyl-CoA carboxylase beta chain